jgi:hypothetical protein
MFLSIYFYSSPLTAMQTRFMKIAWWPQQHSWLWGSWLWPELPEMLGSWWTSVLRTGSLGDCQVTLHWRFDFFSHMEKYIFNYHSECSLSLDGQLGYKICLSLGTGVLTLNQSSWRCREEKNKQFPRRVRGRRKASPYFCRDELAEL